jgi:hypothetical protein
LAAVAVAYVASSTPLYLQPGAPIPDRVKDLVGRMNLAEKVSQLLGNTACKQLVALSFSGSLTHSTLSHCCSVMITPRLAHHTASTSGQSTDSALWCALPRRLRGVQRDRSGSDVSFGCVPSIHRLRTASADHCSLSIAAPCAACPPPLLTTTTARYCCLSTTTIG